MSSAYLVTGGAGFIGSALVRRLAAEGARVRVLDDHSRGAPRRLAGIVGDVELITGDVRDAAVVERATREVGAVFHLAAVNGTEFFYSKPELVLDVAVRGMLNVIDACRAAGVRTLFVASSSEVYQTPPRIPTDETVALSVPDPLNPRYSYGGGKIASELLAINHGRRGFERVVIFRPHNAYGPDMGREHVIPQLTLRAIALAEGTSGTIDLPIQGTGEETRAFLFVEDLIDGIVLLLGKGAHLGIYHIGNDQETTIATLAREIGHVLGREIRVVGGPATEGSTRRRCPDISKMRALGYRPRVPLREGLVPTVRWYDAERS